MDLKLGNSQPKPLQSQPVTSEKLKNPLPKLDSSGTGKADGLDLSPGVADSDNHGQKIPALAETFLDESSKARWENNKTQWTEEIADANKYADSLQHARRDNGDDHKVNTSLKGVGDYLKAPRWERPAESKHELATEYRHNENELRDWLSTQKDVTPGQLLKKSYELNEGDKFDGGITAHNLTKNLAGAEFLQDWDKLDKKEHAEWQKNLKPDQRSALYNVKYSKAKQEEIADDLKLVDNLAQLRPENSQIPEEKMGPWYHSMGIAAAHGQNETFGAIGAKEFANSIDDKLKGDKVDQEKRGIEQVMVNGLTGAKEGGLLQGIVRKGIDTFANTDNPAGPPKGAPPPGGPKPPQ